jgi:hypothetical protein
MDNYIFQGAIKHPCQSRKWFALAEQVINTVYALDNQPQSHVLCIVSNPLRFSPTSRQQPPTLPARATAHRAIPADFERVRHVRS